MSQPLDVAKVRAEAESWLKTYTASSESAPRCNHEACAETPGLPCAQTYSGGRCYQEEIMEAVAPEAFWFPDVSATTEVQIRTRLWRRDVLGWRNRRWFYWRKA